MKCNGDCLNCVYDDCILDDDECYENADYYNEMDRYVKAKNTVMLEYKRLYKKMYYYRFHEYSKWYNRQRYRKNKQWFIRYHLINKKRINETSRAYYKKNKLRDYINWYNKYLTFFKKEPIENPYLHKKLSVTERLEKAEEEFLNFKEKNNIKSRKRKTNNQLFDESELHLIKKANKELQKNIMHSFFIKRKG